MWQKVLVFSSYFKYYDCRELVRIYSNGVYECLSRAIYKSMNFNHESCCCFYRCHLRRIVRIGVHTPMMEIELAGLRSPRPLYRIIYIGRRIGRIADRVNHYSSWHMKSIIGSCNVRYRQICIIQEDRIFRKCRLDCSMVLWWFTVSRINAYCNIKTSSRALFNDRIV